MKARHYQALSIAGLLAGISATFAAAPLAAQANNRGYTRTPDPNAPRIMITTFRSADKKLGVELAEELRSRVNDDVPGKQLTVISGPDIETTLKASGFDPGEPLTASDARELGRQLRADYYMDGNATRNGDQIHVEPRMALVRDNSLVQPLPPVDGRKPGDDARAISREFQAAMKQLPAEQSCTSLARQNKYQEAVQAAQAGITAYPQATLARLCQMAAYDELHDTNSVIRVGQEILRLDPHSRRALQYLAAAYDARKMEDSAVAAYTALVAADPTNANNVDLAVRRITGAGKPQLALPIIQQAVQQNPGDPQLLRTQFLIQLAAKDYKGGVATGEELVKIDTASADTTWFVRMAAAYSADSQPQKAAEVLARGVAKFPNSSSLRMDYVSALRGAGQTQQAVQILRQTVAQNPKTPGANLEIARIQLDMKQPDSAVASLRNALAAGDSAPSVARYAVVIGNQLYRAANATKAIPDYQKALGVLRFADSLDATPNSKFLIGATAYSLAANEITQARESKSCAELKDGQANVTLAQANLPAGGKVSPEAATQLLNALGQLAPYADQLAKALKCK